MPATVTSVPREGRSKAWSLGGHQIPPELLDRAAGPDGLVSDRLAVEVFGAPRRTAMACSVIMSMVAGTVFGWPWEIIAKLSPSTATSPSTS